MAYNADNMKQTTKASKASIMLKKGNIRARVKELQAELQEKHELTTDNIAKMTIQAINEAKADRNHSAVMTGISHLAKLGGLFTDKKQDTTDNIEPMNIQINFIK